MTTWRWERAGGAEGCLAFTVPGKPVPKGRPRVVGRGPRRHAFTPARTRRWETHVHAHAVQARLAYETANANGARRSWPLDARRYDLLLRFVGAHGSADVDNLAKCMLDGMQGALFTNDRSVASLSCFREAQDDLGPRVEVEVTWTR